MYPSLGAFPELFSAAFALNWFYRAFTIMTSSVRKIELHKDGKHVTVSPRIGQAFRVRISDVRKLRDEKELI